MTDYNMWIQLVFIITCVCTGSVMARIPPEYAPVRVGSTLDLCDEYKEDYECQEQQARLSENICEKIGCTTDGNMVEATYGLMELGREELRYTTNGEAIFMIGMTGVGKSTLTYFVGGHDDRMISYENRFRPGEFLIKDCNGKIGSDPTLSTTIIPDLVIESTTNTNYYDNPGFGDRRCPCVEIANAYFMKQVVSNVTRARFGIVMDYNLLSSVTHIPDTLRRVIEFFPGLHKYGNGIFLIATKVNQPRTPDSRFIDAIAGSLAQARATLDQVGGFEGEVLEKGYFLLDHLQMKNRTHISIFRSPDDCGPLLDIALMQENKLNMSTVINRQDLYVNTQVEDFGFALSDGTELVVKNLMDKLSSDMVHKVKEFTRHIEDYMNELFTCTENCDLMTALGALYSNEDFATGYADEISWLELSPTIAVERLTKNETFYNFNIPATVTEEMQKFAGYMDFLGDLYPDANVGVVAWLQPLKDLRISLTDQLTLMLYPKLKTQAVDSLHELVHVVGNATNNIIRENPLRSRPTEANVFRDNIVVISNLISQMILEEPELSDFLTLYLNQLGSLGVDLGDLNETILLQVEMATVLQQAGVRTNVNAQTEQEFWMGPAQFIYGYAEFERNWCIFAVELFGDLSSDKIHVENQGDLKRWWLQGLIRDETTFTAFWSKFLQVPISSVEKQDRNQFVEFLFNKNADKDRRIDELNLLLKTALDPIKCITVPDMVVCNGSFVTLTDVLGSQAVQSGSTKGIIVFSFNSFFLNAQLVGSQINERDNLNILILSPTWFRQSGFPSLDLGGLNRDAYPAIPGNGNQIGLTGRPGGKAGNLVGYGQTFTGGTPSVLVTGGRGQAGQNGQHGTPGQKGARKEWGANFCEAKSGGNVRLLYIGSFEWTCCDYRGDGWCHADDKGCLFEIRGLHGTSGGPGGHGGRGAKGGFGGHSVITNVVLSNNATVVGQKGSDGASGEGGNGGTGGRRGDQYNIHLDDMDTRSAENNVTAKYCGKYGDWHTPSSVQASDGNRGTTGGSSVLPEEPIPNTFNPEQFVTYVQDYKLQANALATGNMYLSPLAGFVGLIRTDPITTLFE